MREDLHWSIPHLSAVRPKGCDLLEREGLCFPLPLIPGKKREGPRADRCGIPGRLVDTARRAYMRAHVLSSVFRKFLTRSMVSCCHDFPWPESMLGKSPDEEISDGA